MHSEPGDTSQDNFMSPEKEITMLTPMLTMILIGMILLGCVCIWISGVGWGNKGSLILGLIGLAALSLVTFHMAPDLGNNRVHWQDVSKAGLWGLGDWLTEGTVYTTLSETPVEDSKVVLVLEKGTKNVFAIRMKSPLPQGDFVVINHKAVAVAE